MHAPSVWPNRAPNATDCFYIKLDVAAQRHRLPNSTQQRLTRPGAGPAAELP
jgi:hypothetical protein